MNGFGTSWSRLDVLSPGLRSSGPHLHTGMCGPAETPTRTIWPLLWSVRLQIPARIYTAQTSSPYASSPHTNSTHTGSPHTSSQQTSSPHTQSPHTRSPHRDSRHVNSPHTSSHTPAPLTPAPHTPTPHTPALHTPSPRAARHTPTQLHQRAAGYVVECGPRFKPPADGQLLHATARRLTGLSATLGTAGEESTLSSPHTPTHHPQNWALQVRKAPWVKQTSCRRPPTQHTHCDTTRANG
eukprot:365301-Chlamydomonas_euryale.AAC.6